MFNMRRSPFVQVGTSSLHLPLAIRVSRTSRPLPVDSRMQLGAACFCLMQTHSMARALPRLVALCHCASSASLQ
jgi:hypothetical protein